ncbi:MAG: zinc carboxypeptidase, partial [Cyclobacteriaceae bacterium]|nr:zinc carboxypeptidase [Cyclobacteriaceae bacterium]
MKKNITSLLAIFLFSIVAVAQQLDLSYYLPKETHYNSEIPKPSDVIGHEVGEWHISHDRLVNYMYAIANASDRISIKQTGQTHEGRPLLILTVT